MYLGCCERLKQKVNSTINIDDRSLGRTEASRGRIKRNTQPSEKEATNLTMFEILCLKYQALELKLIKTNCLLTEKQVQCLLQCLQCEL